MTVSTSENIARGGKWIGRWARKMHLDNYKDLLKGDKSVTP